MISYASHFLQIGDRRCASPLLRELGGGLYALEAFEEECPQTIFYSGTLLLSNGSYPKGEEQIKNVSIEELSAIVSLYRDWELVTPKLY